MRKYRLLKRIIFIVTIFGFFPFTAKPQLICEETFSYKQNVHITGVNGDIGWIGPWFTSPLNSSSNDDKIGSPGMEAGASAIDNKVILTGFDVRNFRYIDTTTSTARALVEDGVYGKTFGKDGTSFWLAFLISLDNYPTAAAGGLHLMDGVGDVTIDMYGDKKNHQRMQFGRQNINTHWGMWRVTNGVSNSTTFPGDFPGTIVANKTARLLVYRMDFKPGTEEVYMWVDPAAGTTPSDASADVKATGVSDFRFNALNIGSQSSAIFSFDELRIGLSYQDVVPTLITAANSPSGVSKFNVFPNPNTGSFSLDLNNTKIENAKIKIYDLTGLSFYEKAINEEISEINLPELSSGIYIIEISTVDKTMREKLIIK